MNLFEGKTQAERIKIIAAAVSCVVALGAIMIRFFIFPPASSQAQSPMATRAANTVAGNSSAAETASRNAVASKPSLAQMRSDPLQQLLPIRFDSPPASVAAVGRNIFTYYRPPPPPAPGVRPEPTPTPAPPPPLILASIAPSNTYAGTGDFTLEVAGDKFTPDSRVTVDDREAPTRFVNAQKLTAAVPAEMIAAAGPRRIVVRTPDGQLYSNVLSFNVSAPPQAPYSYIALIGGPRYNDTAVLKEQSSNKLINVTRGQVVGSQWRVTSISDRAVELTHVTIRVKQQLRFESEPKGGSAMGAANNFPRSSVPPPPAPPQQQPPPVQIEESDDDPED